MSGATALAGVGTGPRLLAGLGNGQRLDLAAHLEVHGPVTSLRTRRRAEHPLIEAIAEAGVRGRGGAGFPTASKLRAVKAAGRRPVVVINGSEGEPLSQKDTLLLLRTPHLVLDGAAAVAEALGAKEVVVYLHRGREAVERSVQAAIRERDDASLFTLVAGPARYVAGESSAVANFLSGGPAIPTTTPPRVSERGVGGRPTMLSNAETYAHIGLVARHGPEWFRTVGTASEPGTLLLTITGAVQAPGVVEVPFGTLISTALELAGGVSDASVGYLLGGYAGTWMRPEIANDLALASMVMRERRAGIGVGLIAVLPQAACVLAETANIMRWLANESARQCGPCLNGLPAIAEATEALATGRVDEFVLGKLERWARMVEGRGSCHHPGGAVQTLRSALDTFADHTNQHLMSGPCSQAHRTWLAIPAVPTGPDADFR